MLCLFALVVVWASVVHGQGKGKAWGRDKKLDPDWKEFKGKYKKKYKDDDEENGR